MDFGKYRVFGSGDRFGFRVAQPLRVASGGIDLLLPGDWDYATASVGQWNASRINLAPQGRELDFETSYALPLVGRRPERQFVLCGAIPGNFAAIAADKGGAVRAEFSASKAGVCGAGAGATPCPCHDRLFAARSRPIVQGGSASQSLANAADLAAHAESLGFTRYWVAEHHGMPGIASAATAVVIAHVGQATRRIRVGAAGSCCPTMRRW